MDIVNTVAGLTGHSQHQVIVYPDYCAANPYQRLLYNGLAPTFRAEITNDWYEVINAANDPFLLHLHWEDAIYRMQEDADAARSRAQHFVDTVERFKDRGGQLIWTVHNEQPHDGRYIEVHQALCEAIEPLVDLFLIHHPTAYLRIKERKGLSDSRLALLPHGNYCDEYSRLGPGRDQRRQQAGYNSDDYILLIFGRLDSYKGTQDFLDAFEKVDSPRLRLIIAGKQVDDISAHISALNESTRERIDYRPGFVSPDDVATLFDLADMIAAPYRAILTSGTTMAAMSVGRPVMAPGLASLREWLDDGETAILYANDQSDALENAIRRFLAYDRQELKQLGDQAFIAAKRYPWGPVHNLLNAIYAHCLVQRKQPRLVASDEWFVLD